MMHEIELTCLDGSNPLGFLAALGVLRLTASAFPNGPMPSLRWHETRHRPVLRCVEIDNIADLAKKLAVDARSVLNESLSQGKYPSATIGVAPESFRSFVRSAMDDPSTDGTHRPLLLSLLAAFGFAHIGRELMERSSFSFANGQSGQNLFGGEKLERDKKSGGLKKKTYSGLRTIAAGPTLVERIEDALTDFREVEGTTSFNWNPSEHRPGAFQGSSGKTRGVPGANVLAFFGLSFFPVIPRGSRAMTTAMVSYDGGDHFIWPLWRGFTGVDTIASLLCRPLHTLKIVDRLAIGIFSVRASLRIEEGDAPRTKYYFSTSVAV